MIAARSFEYLRVGRTHIAVPLAEAVQSEADHRGAQKVAIVASGTLSHKTPVIDELEAALGNRSVGRFDTLVEHAPRHSVFEVVDFLRRTEPDQLEGFAISTYLSPNSRSARATDHRMTPRG